MKRPFLLTRKTCNVMSVCVRVEKAGRNFLLESGSASSDSERESNDDEEKEHPRTKPYVAIQEHRPTEEPSRPVILSSSLKANKLPPPPLGESGLVVGSSVFTNPFKEQADERLSVLQKHVPLTLQARPAQIGGKKMCIGYRKDGRCRFGIRCKFAHDSDLQNSSAASQGDETSSDQTCPTQAPPQTNDCQAPLLQTQEQDGDKLDEGRTKKRRIGLSETLIPPKRSLKQYEVQRQKDRATPF